jgi:hypothetical protein
MQNCWDHFCEPHNLAICEVVEDTKPQKHIQHPSRYTWSSAPYQVSRVTARTTVAVGWPPTQYCYSNTNTITHACTSWYCQSHRACMQLCTLVAFTPSHLTNLCRSATTSGLRQIKHMPELTHNVDTVCTLRKQCYPAGSPSTTCVQHNDTLPVWVQLVTNLRN